MSLGILGLLKAGAVQKLIDKETWSYPFMCIYSSLETDILLILLHKYLPVHIYKKAWKQSANYPVDSVNIYIVVFLILPSCTSGRLILSFP